MRIWFLQHRDAEVNAVRILRKRTEKKDGQLMQNPLGDYSSWLSDRFLCRPKYERPWCALGGYFNHVAFDCSFCYTIRVFRNSERENARNCLGG